MNKASVICKLHEITDHYLLGRELKLDLLMAFAAWDTWEIPYILEKYGYIDEPQAEELCIGPLVEMEPKLRCYVFQAYLQFLNRSELRH